MTEPLFEIAPDPRRCFMRVTWRGLWQVGTVKDYLKAVTVAGEQMFASGCTPDTLRVLVDARTFGPQSQDVVTAYGAAIEGQETRVGRVATLTGSALFQLQVKRVGLANNCSFTDEAEALAWLFGPEA